ncbi:hypothetical protein HRbin40_02284 [bacterium HR40]|nr:hypothetical protein HRbin40_02284 [bacterium HR40]
MCIAHLGHSHHLLTEDQLAALGRIAVPMAPIDGAWTMSQAEMVEVIELVAPSIVLPMPSLAPAVPGRFLALTSGGWQIEIRDEPVLELSRRALPRRRVIVLPEP